MSFIIIKNITLFPTVKMAGRKLCYIKEQIIGIAMVLERDFDNLKCVWSCMFCKGFLKT